MMDMIHVAYVRLDLSDDENRHVGASMASIMEHSSSSFIFHIIYDGNAADNNITRTEENIQKYNKLVQKYSNRINFHKVSLPQDLAGNPANYRLLMPEILPDVDIVISLGFDTVVHLNLMDIVINYPVDKYSLSGCVDTTFNTVFEQWTKPVKKYYADIGIINERYCNADMMIFNLKKMREENTFPDNVFAFLKEHPQAWHNEQDALNSVFRDDIYILPQRCNIQSRDEEFVNEIILTEDIIKGYIIHSKSWIGGCGKIDSDYWYYLSLTPWGEGKQLYEYMGRTLSTPFDIINNMESYIKQYPYKHIVKLLWSFTIPLYWKLFRRYLQYIKCGFMDYGDLRKSN